MVILNNSVNTFNKLTNNTTSNRQFNSVNSITNVSERSLNNYRGSAGVVVGAAESVNRLLDSNSLLYTTALENLYSTTTTPRLVTSHQPHSVLSTSLPVSANNTDSPSFITRANQLIQHLEKNNRFVDVISPDDSLEDKTEFIHFEPDYSDDQDEQDSSNQHDEVEEIYLNQQRHRHQQITINQSHQSSVPEVVYSTAPSDNRKFVDLSLFFYSPPHNLLQTSTDSSILTSSTNSTSSSSQLQSSINSTATSSDSERAAMMMSNVVATQPPPLDVKNPNSVYYTSNMSSNGELSGYGMDRSSSNGSNSSGDEHERLLAEMELIERLPTQERLKQAKRRRALQLKKWSEYEKELLHGGGKKKRGGSRFIKFQDHVVLLDAVMRKDYNEVERLLQMGISPNVANEDGLTAIHQCCIDDDDELLLLLIRHGANVNVVDNDQWTPLHAAATCGNVHISKILIENNADLLAVNTDGNMPYDICDEEVCLEYIESEMAARGITQQTIDMKRGETETRMLNDLRQICFKQLNQVLSYHKNRLMGKSVSTSQVVLSFLAYFNNAISNDDRLDLNAKDMSGATLLHIACANGYNSIVEFLLKDCRVAAENGAPIIPSSLLSRDNDGWTPLHVATFWGHQRTIELLLENGADIHAKTNSEDTVLDLCDDSDVREFIIQKSKEIETEQQKQAAARAAAALKLQMITNSNSMNSSTQNLIKNGGDKTNSSNNINNSSTRSLKRTSTGVSRSSSVRRSSFRDKEKAKKLDISFKDVLYANEIQDKETDPIQNTVSSMVDSSILSSSMPPPASTNSLTSPKINENNHLFLVSGDESGVGQVVASQEDIKPVVINHNKDLYAQNGQKLTTVVKIINNNTSTGSPQTKKYEDIKPSNVLPNQVARIQSHGGSTSTQQYQPSSAMAFNLNPIMSSSTNYSMTSSMVSNSSALLPNNTINNNTTNGYSFHNTTNSTVNNLLNNHPHSHHESGSNNTLLSGGSSVAIIDVSAGKQSNGETKTDSSILNQPLKAAKSNENYVYGHTQIVQPTTTSQPSAASKVNGGAPLNQDSLKYKFKSNETIGLRNTNAEFDDINVKTNTTAKMNKCAQCFKCCHVM